MARFVRTTAILIPLLAALAGCSDDDGPPLSPTATGTPTRTPTATPTATAPPTATATTTVGPAVRLEGRLHSFGCDGESQAVVGVTLEPGGRTTSSAEGGRFVFEDVPPGDYVLAFDLSCGVMKCYPDQPVTVAGEDLVVDVCHDPCPPPLLDPAVATAGSEVRVRGRCYDIHSGRTGYVYFDQQRVATVVGDTPGNYDTTFAIPLDAAPGVHAVTLTLDPDAPTGAASSDLTVLVE